MEKGEMEETFERNIREMNGIERDRDREMREN